MKTLAISLFLLNYNYISVIKCEDDENVHRASANAKFLDKKNIGVDGNTSITCWQCAALPSM